MSQEDKLIGQIKAGKQVGARFSFVENEVTYWSSVGIQLHGGVCKAYIDEIDESLMDAEDYRKEFGKSFSSILDALDWVRKNSCVKFDELGACKGGKVFNPAFIE